MGSQYGAPTEAEESLSFRDNFCTEIDENSGNINDVNYLGDGA
jgi:hypothetical protein